MHLDQCHNHCNDGDIDQDNGDDGGDHIGVDDDDGKDEKDSVVKEMAVHNKGSPSHSCECPLLPQLPIIKSTKVRQTLKSLFSER